MLNTFFMRNMRKYTKTILGPWWGRGEQKRGGEENAREEEGRIIEISLKRNKGKNQHSKCSVLIYLIYPHRRSKGVNN